MTNRSCFALIAMLALGGCSLGAFGAEPPAGVVAPSPQDQWDTASDSVTTQQIRALVTGDASLAADGANVAIRTTQHVVVLRGHVASETERRTIAGYARGCEGVTHVENQLVVGL